MVDDWVDDASLSREETLARFRALEPQATRGPGVESAERDTPVDDSDRRSAEVERAEIASAPTLACGIHADRANLRDVLITGNHAGLAPGVPVRR